MAKVLVCDDSSYMRSKIIQLLNQMGHEVIGEASDGESALEKYYSLHPDIMTLDVIMPKKHGIDVLKELIESDPFAQVVLVSAVTHQPLIMKGLKIGALNFITKPFTSSEFIDGLSMVG
ncbi:MAG: response regulator [Candidatus Heimdallarchaeota archaeon]|nr:response regulator [Candidatus Heimdallarchaeota archaeon]